MVSSTTVHHSTGLCIGSIQGNSKIIIDLNGGSGRYKCMCISCLAFGIPLLLLFARIILLLFSAIWLYVTLFITVVAGEIGVILSLLFAI